MELEIIRCLFRGLKSTATKLSEPTALSNLKDVYNAQPLRLPKIKFLHSLTFQ